MAKHLKNPIEAAAQRLRRWRRSPLLLKRLPGGTRIHVIKRIDPISYKLLSDQDIINAFRALVTANKWDQKNSPQKTSSTSKPPSET